MNAPSLARRIARRLVIAASTFVGITVVVFVATRALPDVDVHAVDSTAIGTSVEERNAIASVRGLDRPWLVQYGEWLGSALRLDFGRSWANDRRVGAILADVVPRTIQITVPAILLCYLVGVPLGVLLALRRRSVLARTATIAIVAAICVPGFVAATLAIVFFANPDFFAWFPATGLSGDDAAPYGGLAWLVTSQDGRAFAIDRLRHLVLPVTCMALPGVAYIAEQTRASMVTSLEQPWIEAARARGLGERRVVFGHALRDAAVPIVVLLGLALPTAFSGSVFLERVFSIEGVGWTFVQAVGERDLPVVGAIATLVAGLTLVGLVVADLSRAALDPRVTFR